MTNTATSAAAKWHEMSAYDSVIPSIAICAGSADKGTDNPDEGTDNSDKGTDNPDKGTDNPDEGTDNPDEGTDYPDQVQITRTARWHLCREEASNDGCAVRCEAT